MTWVKLDDRFPDNPKVSSLSDGAAWLYVRGLCYCAGHLTDGTIPKAALIRPLAARKRHISEIVDAGLWHESDGGAFLVHDYLKYNPARAKVEAERQAAAERMKRHRTPEDTAECSPEQSPKFGNGSPSPSRPLPSGSPPDRIQPETSDPKDLKASPRAEPQPDDDAEKATICPLDLEERAVKLGLLAEFARRYLTSEDSIGEQVHEFVSFWTIGGGSGKRKANWMLALRQRLKELGEQKRFRAQGEVSHEQRKAARMRVLKPKRQQPEPEPLTAEERRIMAEGALAKLRGA